MSNCLPGQRSVRLLYKRRLSLVLLNIDISTIQDSTLIYDDNDAKCKKHETLPQYIQISVLVLRLILQCIYYLLGLRTKD